MSERAAFRGARGGGRGDRGGGGRGGRGGGGGTGAGAGTAAERPKKENILDLGKYADKRIIVKFNGGREGELCLVLWVLRLGVVVVVAPLGMME